MFRLHTVSSQPNFRARRCQIQAVAPEAYSPWPFLHFVEASLYIPLSLLFCKPFRQLRHFGFHP